MVNGAMEGMLNAAIAFIVVFLVGVVMDLPSWYKKKKQSIKNQSNENYN